MTSETTRIASLCRRIDQALQRSRPVIDPARDRTIQEARRMRRAGTTLTVIARKFGVSTALASKWCRDIAARPLSTGGGSRFAGVAGARAAAPPPYAPQSAPPGLTANAQIPGPSSPESEHAVPHGNRVKQETRAIENRFRSGTDFRQLGTDPAPQRLPSGTPAVEHTDRGTE